MKRFLPLLLLLASSAVMADSGSYQVEVIIFSNLLNTPEFNEVPELRSFSRFPDIADSGLADNPPAKRAAVQSGLLPVPSFQVMARDLPDDVRVVTQKSNAMEDAWRRLRSSQDYRPLVYAAWEQNQVDYYPPMRIHDQQVIATQLSAPTMIMVADLTTDDPLGAYRGTFYQLDGSLQLRRSRFLHLYLDLEFREQLPPGGYDEVVNGGVGIPREIDGVERKISTYGVYALKQNRQISTGEMQYFDTPSFGALVYVTHTP